MTKSPPPNRERIYDPTIIVCSRCFRTCCWHGEFMCEDAVEANIVKRKISTLIKRFPMGLEHPDYWNADLYEANKRLLTVKDLKKLGIKDKNSLTLCKHE